MTLLGKYIKATIDGADTMSITTLIINDKVLNYFLIANTLTLKAVQGYVAVTLNTQ
jgi:hypothetical protein